MDLAVYSSRREEVLKLFGKNQDDVDSDLMILKEWSKKHPYLPLEILTDDYLERVLVKNKFSIEKAKKKIENYFILKKQFRYMFNEDNFQAVIPSKEAQFYIPILELTDNLNRVVISKVFDEENYDMKRDFTVGLVMRELMGRYDYSYGEVFIYDFSDCSSTFLTKFRPNIIIDGTTLFLEAYSARVREVHIVSKLAKSILSLLKPLMPTKIFDRIHAHDKAEDVSKYIPAKCLPKEFGGELKSLVEILHDFDETYMKIENELHTIMRTMPRGEMWMENKNYESVSGTFKQLVID
ncbi:hypothetical protein HHI36_000623 [Cryptolaemus montrouzieri]|uniref:CRAL-TRIO domain-containing protein n=1 Tax=Cryptolaemus montrouzieri TaxID=559131 RepID=A0ABD2P5I7_9CUCU